MTESYFEKIDNVINNIDNFINDASNFTSMTDFELYNILDSQNVEFKHLFIIISYLDSETLFRILHYSDFYDNTIVLCAILISLLNCSDKLFNDFYDNPYQFIKHDNTMIGCINRLKEIYKLLYNENIKLLCFKGKFTIDFVNLLQYNYFKFNIINVLSQIKNLIIVLEYIYKSHKLFYDTEREYNEQSYPNQEQAMHYEEIFNNFVIKYNKKIEKIKINENTEIINVNNVVMFLL